MMERIAIFPDFHCHFKGIASRKAARKATGANSGCITSKSENQLSTLEKAVIFMALWKVR